MCWAGGVGAGWGPPRRGHSRCYGRRRKGAKAVVRQTLVGPGGMDGWGGAAV